MADSYEDQDSEDHGSDEMFRGPNDGAYEKEEARTGPPVDYVAEKCRSSIELTHSLINALSRASIADPENRDGLLSQARGSLRYQLTG